MPQTGMERLLDITLGVAIRWLFTTSRWVRSDGKGITIAVTRVPAADEAAAATLSEPTDPFGESPEPGEVQPADVGPHADTIVSIDDAWHAQSRRRAGVIRVAPPPSPESETPAHRVLRLGDAPESPIHSQDPADWEDVTMSSGEVWAMPRGLTAMGERAAAALQVRKTFHRIK